MATVSQAAVDRTQDYDLVGPAGPVVLDTEGLGWDAEDLDPAGDSWDTWTDEHDGRWTLGPDPELGDDEGLTLDGLIALEIGRFRRMGTEAGDLMAEALTQLAVEASITGAETPAQLRDRREALELSMAERMAQGRWPYDFEGWVPPGAMA